MECSYIDYNYRIINSNGLEVEQCGNGARCIAYYLFLKENIKKKICISTKNRYLYLQYLNKNFIRVNMGKPLFHPKSIPFLQHSECLYYFININNKSYKISIVSMGNPHCIIIVNSVCDKLIKEIGYLLSKHSLFPNGVNVSFMRIISKNKIFLNVYERDVGETKACGTGACAAVVTGIRNNLLDNNVIVTLPGGKLKIQWNGGKNDSVYMLGEAVHVYDGYLQY